MLKGLRNITISLLSVALLASCTTDGSSQSRTYVYRQPQYVAPQPQYVEPVPQYAQPRNDNVLPLIVGAAAIGAAGYFIGRNNRRHNDDNDRYNDRRRYDWYERQRYDNYDRARYQRRDNDDNGWRRHDWRRPDYNGRRRHQGNRCLMYGRCD